ncbi:type II 3-dehydroquinate dehydratase [uncultured Rikenella sp.]|uniref:type II 3-dehydroquinate dehydratase n=1 Tax=uncultured Rikenella sp. TaxID=368003 RepID=UPI0026083A7D|nr:type II 3-dehydroquinate dehydratase [uncultured Rikenella sp.]
MKKILIINGPNLNLLGVRDREVYGSRTFEDYLTELVAEFEGVAELDYVQSNVEGVLIDAIHGAREIYDGVVLNAGGYTHTSVALADAVGAVAGCGLGTVEVHISNILAREEFRHVSLIAPRCRGSIMGFGLESYRLAIRSFL